MRKHAQRGISRRIKILHVFPNFRVGGSQMRLAMLVGALGTDIEHTVVSIDGDHAARTLLPANADITYVKAPTAGNFVSRIWSYSRYLRNAAPDILITYNWGAMEWAMANAFNRLPHIHMEDGFGPEEIHRQIPRRVWARRILLRHSTLVVPSATLGDIASRIWKIKTERLKHIPNGIAPNAPCKTAIAELGLNLPDLPRIVWVGALRPEKNPLRLLRAFSQLRGEAVLLILGSGPKLPDVIAEAERLSLLPCIRLLGHRIDARDIVMQCDILALSSDTEQMPFAILEAMAAGLAVASVDVGDVRQMVAAENRPFIVPPCENALGAALRELSADPALRARIGRANRLRLRERYDARTMASRYADLFHTVAMTDECERPAHVQ